MSTGAHAEQIGQHVADQLGFRSVNEEIIARAAAKAGLTPEAIAEVERSTPLAKRVLDAMAGLTPLIAQEAAITAEFYGSLARIPNVSALYQNLIREVIRETAFLGSVVIVAHGASIHLAGTDGLLRVFVTASPEIRANRVAAEEHVSTEAARKKIDHTDRERQAYLQRFYDIKRELPTHYDLVLITDVLSPATAAKAIVTTAQGMA